MKRVESMDKSQEEGGEGLGGEMWIYAYAYAYAAGVVVGVVVGCGWGWVRRN